MIKEGRDTMKNTFSKLKKDNQGIGVVEIILILVILIALVILFRNEITEIVKSVLGTIEGSSDSLKQAVPTVS